MDSIRKAYFRPNAGKVEVFQAVLTAAEQVGIQQVLAALEQCVLEKRSAWLAAYLPAFQTTLNPIQDAYRLFYQDYLHLTIPADGEVVERSDRKLVMRWWNPCPTLDACQRFNLDTRQVCRLAYHQPVQIFLSALHPGLRFERNYACLRPHTPYCEELILLEA